MTRQQQIKLATVSFIIIAIFSSSFFVWRRNQNFQNRSRASTPQKIIIPSLNPVLKIETASQTSPDGTKNLKMKKIPDSDGSYAFIFTVMDGTGANEHALYTAKVQNPENLSIPFNTWSPDNKYLFIQKNENGALVFKANGEPIINDQTFFNVEDIFNDKNKNVIPKIVTGWASPTLLIVNTVKEDKSKGPSYWFEVPSQAIIQLSSQF
ncbi:hypothetical protein HY338_00165 [Candidatus Gottesmanbacteria bacterium]|nr:hypothetical protein [Candidatus Gottesmanbacteria bacterium]